MGGWSRRPAGVVSVSGSGSQIEIARESGHHVDSRRRYNVIIDGKLVGRLRPGESGLLRRRARSPRALSEDQLGTKRVIRSICSREVWQRSHARRVLAASVRTSTCGSCCRPHFCIHAATSNSALSHGRHPRDLYDRGTNRAPGTPGSHCLSQYQSPAPGSPWPTGTPRRLRCWRRSRSPISSIRCPR